MSNWYQKYFLSSRSSCYLPTELMLSPRSWSLVPALWVPQRFLCLQHGQIGPSASPASWLWPATSAYGVVRTHNYAVLTHHGKRCNFKEKNSKSPHVIPTPVSACQGFRHRYRRKSTVTSEVWQACVLHVVQQETPITVILNIQRTIKFPRIKETLSQTGSKVNKGWD